MNAILVLPGWPQNFHHSRFSAPNRFISSLSTVTQTWSFITQGSWIKTRVTSLQVWKLKNRTRRPAKIPSIFFHKTLNGAYREFQGQKPDCNMTVKVHELPVSFWFSPRSREVNLWDTDVVVDTNRKTWFVLSTTVYHHGSSSSSKYYCS